MGQNDSFDKGDGGPITLKLSQVKGVFESVWFDPRTGDELPNGSLSGGQDYVVDPPSKDDWVLLLTTARD